MRRRVVVTGLGAVTPVGNDVATTWRALQDGVCRCVGNHEVRSVDVPGALRLRGEGLRSAQVDGAEGSEARGSLHAVRGRRVRGGDERRRPRHRHLRRRPARRHRRKRHRRAEELRGAARHLPRARGEQDQPLLHPDVHRRHRGRRGVHALQCARAQLRHRVGLLDERARHRRRVPHHSVRRRRHHDLRRIRGRRHGDVDRWLRQHDGALHAQRQPGDGLASVRQGPRRLRHG